MSRGRFIAGKNGKAAKYADPYAVKDKSNSGSGGLFSAGRNGGFAAKLWPILAAVAGVAVLVVGVLLLKSMAEERNNDPTAPATTALRGQTRAELEQKANELDQLLRTQDLVLTLSQTPDESGQTEEPLILTLSPADSGAGLEMNRLRADLDGDVEAAKTDNYLVDLRKYLSVKESVLHRLARNTVLDFCTEYVPSEVKEQTEEPEEEGAQPRKYLVVTKGVVGRSLTEEEIFEALQNAYSTVISAENPAAALSPTLRYEVQRPEPVDLGALCEQYYRAPVDAVYDAETNAVVPSEEGYGFDLDGAKELMEKTADGVPFRIALGSIAPALSTEELESMLFRDVLAEAHTPHTAVANRTTNLKLACAAINGTVIEPGEVFSFNKVVGQRTTEKGYKEAIAYVSGGESRPEVGGGVCQVASSIYYAVLQADLKTVERANHMYLVSYVPYGMDAAIYWGSLDYKFENNSPYPVRVDASVSDGQVHIVLIGTEWKSYTVKMSYEILETFPWGTVNKEVPNDGTYHNGEVITSPYTGYRIATYRTIVDNDGTEHEAEQLTVDKYNKRDKVIAVVKTTPKPTEPQPTEPKPTEPKPTEPQPTEPPPTEPPPTEPEPTEPEPTEPPPTEPEPSEDDED